MKSINIYVNNLDENTKKQFDDCIKEKYVVSAALMPDAHLGYAAPIGAVIKTKEYIVPAWVGFDIGCGVCAIKITGTNVEEIKKHSKEIHKIVSKYLPMGVGQKNEIKNISSNSLEEINKLIAKYKSGPKNPSLFNFFRQSAAHNLGTLGGGNHFIELGNSGKDVWLVVHSGSRGIGHRIATFYMQEAANKNKNKNIETTCPIEAKSELGKEYLAAHDICSEYALLNRLEMADKTVKTIEKVLKKKLKTKLWINKNHNHVVYENGFYIHRKGATPAKKGERGVIPANMRDGSILVIGKGNSKFLNSSSHGAGRIMSRKDSNERISLLDFKKEMSGISATVTEQTKNESPGVYKNIYTVMNAQKASVKTFKTIKPLINWKGIENKFRD